MNKILDVIKKNKMSLFVSLPSNDYELAKAAWENGADAIKVHIDVDHTASQSKFGTLESQKNFLKQVIKDSPVPVGIVIGNSADVAEKNLCEIIEIGFDFVSLYGHDSPVLQGFDRKITNMFAINYTYSMDEISWLSSYGLIDLLEMSILPPELYGTRLTLRNLAKYKKIKEIAKVPTVLPSQHLILPSDIKYLHWANINCLMIGAIVTGKTKESLIKAVKEMKEAINKL